MIYSTDILIPPVNAFPDPFATTPQKVTPVNVAGGGGYWFCVMPGFGNCRADPHIVAGNDTSFTANFSRRAVSSDITDYMRYITESTQPYAFGRWPIVIEIVPMNHGTPQRITVKNSDPIRIQNGFACIRLVPCTFQNVGQWSVIVGTDPMDVIHTGDIEHTRTMGWTGFQNYNALTSNVPSQNFVGIPIRNATGLRVNVTAGLVSGVITAGTVRYWYRSWTGCELQWTASPFIGPWQLSTISYVLPVGAVSVVLPDEFITVRQGAFWPEIVGLQDAGAGNPVEFLVEVEYAMP